MHPSRIPLRNARDADSKHSPQGIPRDGTQPNGAVSKPPLEGLVDYRMNATTLSAYFTDAEVDEMTDGLVQDAAKIRYLRRLGLRVDRKPNGRPLAWRASPATGTAPDRDTGGASVTTGLETWAAKRKGRHGPQTQGW